MTVRRNQATLTYTERKAFVDAVLALKKSGGYDPFVATHLEYMSRDSDAGARVAHRAPSFLPWHRQFLLNFERALQKINPAVFLPYWDWTTARATNSAPWLASFMGGNGRSGDGQVTTGPFAYATGRWTLNVRTDSRPFLRRQMGSVTSLPTATQRAQVIAAMPYDSEPYNSASATGFRNQLEGWRGPDLHNRVHVWVGGTMAGGDSPNDPVFWLHHCYIDKLWADWQAAHPGAGYLPTATTLNVIALNDLIPPWNTYRPIDLLDHRRFYTYA
ncbi:MAG TPA: tyrosinase family protein [Actinoplanes sp.]|nr:tyrosinase family protein [Actinoplanes sp.]